MTFIQSAHLLELYVLINVIVLVETQRHLKTAAERGFGGFTGTQDRHAHLFDQGESINLSNVLAPDVVLPDVHGNQPPHPVAHRETGSVSHNSDVNRLSAQHVNLQGQLGNESPHPVVHRHPGAHVDLPGQHGNESPHPVVHRHPGAHVDLPGQHGNESPHPVVHRQPGAHVDLPGQHGNESPHPVVHRHPGAHVDLPGQHGNESPHPVVHRHSGAHVDLPGQHGNESPHPVVHRHSGALVDLPGQHGNESPHPVVHRHPGAHVDLPGQHGNESPHPVVHRHPGAHVDLPGQQDLSIHRQSRFIDPVSGTPVVLMGQNNRIGSFPTGPVESIPGANRLTLDSAISTRTVLPSMIVPQPPTGRPLGFPVILRHRDARLPGSGFHGGLFHSPFGPERFGPPPFLLSPVSGRMGPIGRRMRRRMVMGGLLPPFPPLRPPPLHQPPPLRPPRTGFRRLLVGVIGSLLGNLFRR